MEVGVSAKEPQWGPEQAASFRWLVHLWCREGRDPVPGKAWRGACQHPISFPLFHSSVHPVSQVGTLWPQCFPTSVPSLDFPPPLLSGRWLLP